MKNISLIFAVFIFTSLAIGQAPNYINYQGVLRDANGNVVANKSISGSIVISGGSNYTFSIPTGGSTNGYGLFNFKIGFNPELKIYENEIKSKINESFEQTAKLYPENEILEKVKNEIVSNWEFHFNKINELYNIEISMNKVQE